MANISNQAKTQTTNYDKVTIHKMTTSAKIMQSIDDMLYVQIFL